jgi:hypothetical protein
VLERSYQDALVAVTPLEFLRGEWAVHRDVIDRRSGRAGVFIGTAGFAGTGSEGTGFAGTGSEGTGFAGTGSEGTGFAGTGELRYHEEGELTFGDHRGPAYRRLLYRMRGDGKVAVHFEDGRDFYVLDLSDQQQWGADHLCGADLYTVSGLVTGPDSFTERWHAGGPAKDYDLITAYRRITTGRPPSA